MSAAKHRDKIYQREFKASVARQERKERHEALLQQHKEHRERKVAGIADSIMTQSMIEVITELADE